MENQLRRQEEQEDDAVEVGNLAQDHSDCIKKTWTRIRKKEGGRLEKDEDCCGHNVRESDQATARKRLADLFFDFKTFIPAKPRASLTASCVNIQHLGITKLRHIRHGFSSTSMTSCCKTHSETPLFWSIKSLKPDCGCYVFITRSRDWKRIIITFLVLRMFVFRWRLGLNVTLGFYKNIFISPQIHNINFITFVSIHSDSTCG
jgi:hypothetical protein